VCYRRLTREAYAPDVRQFIGWWQEHNLRLFSAQGGNIECFPRDIEAPDGRARRPSGVGCAQWPASTGTASKRGSSKVAGSTRRRPRREYESHATSLLSS
jgi:hypothetical protein